MIESLFPDVKALIIDMDGVLWKANDPIGNLQAVFSRIHQMGLKTVFATNNSTRTVDKYVERLHQFGIETDPEHIVTSSIATAHILKKTLSRWRSGLRCWGNWTDRDPEKLWILSAG
jgi:ribonucleotide monophosphatase NagD (HAD superfamily)